MPCPSSVTEISRRSAWVLVISSTRPPGRLYMTSEWICRTSADSLIGCPSGAATRLKIARAASLAVVEYRRAVECVTQLVDDAWKLSGNLAKQPLLVAQLRLDRSDLGEVSRERQQRLAVAERDPRERDFNRNQAAVLALQFREKAPGLPTLDARRYSRQCSAEGIAPIDVDDADVPDLLAAETELIDRRLVGGDESRCFEAR